MAATKDLSTFFHGVGDLFFHLNHSFVVHQGTDGHTLFQAIAGLHARHSIGQCLQKFLQDFIVHENTVGANAGLTGVEELDQLQAFGCMHRISIL